MQIPTSHWTREKEKKIFVNTQIAHIQHIHERVIYDTNGEGSGKKEASNILYALLPLCNMHYIIELNEDIIYH